MGVDTTVSGGTSSPITKEFLEKILKKKVSTFKTSGGSNPGDNYTSILISLDIVLEDDPENPLHLLFKTFPNHPTRQKLLEESNVFLREYQVYDIWLRELVKFQKEIVGNEKLLMPAMPEMVAGAAVDYDNASPDQWKALDPVLNNFILMVDLRKTHGFQMANKLKGLGHQNVKIVLEELAKYHALGYAYKLHHKLPTIFSKFPFIEDPFFTNPYQRPTVVSMMKGNVQLIKETCKDFLEERPEIKESLEKNGDPERIADYLKIFLDANGMDEEVVEGFMRVKKYSGEPIKDQWILTGHGDCWSNNILFKHDDNGNVTAAVLVDLQIGRESCLMADLVYFLYSSTDTEFRKQHLDEMVKLYYDKFIEFCEILKVKPFANFTLENFQRKFHRSKIFGFLFATMIYPIILQRQETTMNMDDMEIGEGGGSDDWAAMFQNLGRDEDDNKLLRERFTKLLDEMYEEGIL